MFDLKCCPFCGAQGYNKTLFIAWDEKAFWIVCEFCNAKGPRSESGNDAANKWNRRESK